MPGSAVRACRRWAPTWSSRRQHPFDQGLREEPVMARTRDLVDGCAGPAIVDVDLHEVESAAVEGFVGPCKRSAGVEGELAPVLEYEPASTRQTRHDVAVLAVT